MKRILAFCLALLLCLSGCASLLERDYTVAQPHEDDPPPRGDGAYRVETYPALRSALLSYVEEGMDTGELRFPTTYPGNLTVDLEKARRQLMEEDPLGNYALADLTWRTSKIIAYYEAELTFTYKMDKAAFRSIPRIHSQAALSHRLAEAIEKGEDQVVVYLTAYPQEDEGYFDAALAAALGGQEEGEGEELPVADDLPEETAEDAEAPLEEQSPLTVELYPQSGVRRIAVIGLEGVNAHD